ncbi:MAG: hypothetical protein ACRECO_11750 [Xanthobacteraceae bacterium]
MEKVRKSLILLLVAGIPAAAPPFLAASPDLCFTDGTVTYRLASNASSADYAVAIDGRAPYPDLRIGLVDGVASADFALTDDAGAPTGNACKTAGILKTVRIVGAGEPADTVIRVSRDSADADVTLYVHSARVNHFDAAALFALMRHAQAAKNDDADERLAQFR